MAASARARLDALTAPATGKTATAPTTSTMAATDAAPLSWSGCATVDSHLPWNRCAAFEGEGQTPEEASQDSYVSAGRHRHTLGGGRDGDDDRGVHRRDDITHFRGGSAAGDKTTRGVHGIVKSETNERKEDKTYRRHTDRNHHRYND